MRVAVDCCLPCHKTLGLCFPNAMVLHLLCRVAGKQPALCALAGGTAAQVVMVRCDTSAAVEAAAAFDSSAGLPAVAGIMNSGGILQDAVLTAQTAAGMRAVYAPKLASAVAMQHAATAQPLHQLLLFSSAASLFGAPGQSNYAAANAALEGHAAGCTASGMNSIAIQWGAWAAGACLLVLWLALPIVV